MKIVLNKYLNKIKFIIKNDKVLFFQIVLLLLLLLVIYRGFHHLPDKTEINEILMNSKQKNLYIIDVGHGYTGECKGNHVKLEDGSCFYEYQYCYDLYKKIDIMLKKSNIFSILLDTNVLVQNMPINTRVREVNNIVRKVNRANITTLVISLHANYTSKNPDATGVEVYINLEKQKNILDASLYNEAMTNAAILFANNLAHYSGLPLRKSRGKEYKLSELRPEDCGILKRTKCYAILTENGFFSNEKERNKMQTDKFKTNIAYAHYASICEIEGIIPYPINIFYEQ